MENFWAGKSDESALEETAKILRARHWNYQQQAEISAISVNDFSFYDLVLDNIITFGCVPPRFKNLSGLEQYFALARGHKTSVALEMTKWFNTNYHYIVPELDRDTKFELNASKILNEYKEAKAEGIKGKINLIGPITFLALSKTTDGSCAFEHFDALLREYKELLSEISKLDDEILVQFDEPIFVTDKDEELLGFITKAYGELASVASNVKIIFATYFEHALKAVNEVVKTKIYAVALDFVHAEKNKAALEIIEKSDLVLFAGVVDGRNIWKSNIDEKVKFVKEISAVLNGKDFYIGTSCSLLHVPYTLKYEEKLDPRIKSWLSFAVEKLDEIKIITKLANNGALNSDEAKIYALNQEAIKTRSSSNLIHSRDVANRVANLSKFERDTPYVQRIKVQKEALGYGILPSYGSRCVKPPLLFGDVSRPKPMTLEWITYAQSKTDKIVKGMLTDPVTILNWSFVRDDKPRSEIARQLALCIYDEISDLQDAGIKIIQVDEAAFKEGYLLRAENVAEYEKFAVDCFKLCVSSASAKTQIHTHMCYSEFNDIIKTIEAMDADVISIETARSGNELLKIFKEVGYKQEVGPGIYDIHSPRVPEVGEMVEQIKALLEVLPREQLWINPDCGLKTRKWDEVRPSLINLVEAVKIARSL